MKNLIKLPALIIILSAVLSASCGTENPTYKTTQLGGSAAQYGQDYAEGGGEGEGVSERPEERPEAGYHAPRFSIELLGGEKAELSDYRGKAVLISFWATWCGICAGGMPDIQKLSDEYGDELFVLTVNCSEDKNQVQNFIKETGYDFAVGLDSSGAIQDLYGPIGGIPYTVIIDPDGVIIATHLGAAGDMFSVFEGYIKDALEK